MAGPWSETFPAQASSAARARRFVEAVLTRGGRLDLVDTALLLVSELVTNALLHASSDVRLVVALGDEGALVEVHDASPVFPAVRRYGVDAATGRGLLLVEDLSDAWDVEATESGKKIWFRLSSSDAAGDESSLGAALLAGLDLSGLDEPPARRPAGAETSDRPRGPRAQLQGTSPRA